MSFRNRRFKIQFPSARHLTRYRSFVGYRQQSRGHGENRLILEANVLLVHLCKASHRLAKLRDLDIREAAMREIPLSETLDYGVQGSSPAMFLLKLFHPRESHDDFRGVNLTQSGEQRLFFVGRMFWRRMSEVMQRRFESPVYFLGRRAVDDPSHRLEHAEEHLHAPMAVRQ